MRQQEMVTQLFGDIGAIRESQKNIEKRFDRLEAEIRNAPARRVSVAGAVVSIAGGIVSCIKAMGA